ncbi:MAG: STAS domain-containing protein [Planctomycetes bacterium]|nr:STAS domain-containing protein [Planctomycetota bacterium]
MPLYEIPVVIPYRLDRDPSAALYGLQVNTIASKAVAAIAVAQMLAQALARLHHPGRTSTVLIERAKAGATGRMIDGPYAYVMGHGNHIHHLAFPRRIDHHGRNPLGEAFDGLDPAKLHGLVLDCANMQYINSTGLAALAAHSDRLRIHLFRIGEPLRKVFDLVGLTHLMQFHDSMQLALEALVARSR